MRIGSLGGAAAILTDGPPFVDLRYKSSHPDELDTLDMLPCGELDWLLGEHVSLVGRERLRALAARRYAALLSCTTCA